MTKRRLVLSLLLLAFSTVLAGILTGAPGLPAQTPPQAATQAAGSLNNEDCATCHEEVVKAFDHNPHAVLEKSPRHNMKNSCESCHGPGEEHATNDGNKAKIIGFKGTAARRYNERCLACHRNSADVHAFGGTMHAKALMACTDCHRVHTPAGATRLLKTQTNSLCLGCHAAPRTDFSKPFHHRVKENAMRCTDCHQPHSGLDRRMARVNHAGEAACVRCHTDKEGPFVFEHASLRVRNCLACHEPHGSNNPKMLVRATVRSLCLECHSLSRNAIVAQPPSFHDVRSPRYQSCTTCHVKIHGSNSSPIFLR